MSDRAAMVTRVVVQSDDERITTDVDALSKLGDGAFLAYVMIRMFKFGMSLFVKRWPELDSYENWIKSQH